MIMNSAIPIELAYGAAGLIAGLAVGGCHFASLHWNGRLFRGGQATCAFGLQLARVVLTSTALFALARLGALSFVAGLAGFLLARGAAMRVFARVLADRP